MLVRLVVVTEEAVPIVMREELNELKLVEEATGEDDWVELLLVDDVCTDPSEVTADMIEDVDTELIVEEDNVDERLKLLVADDEVELIVILLYI